MSDSFATRDQLVVNGKSHTIFSCQLCERYNLARCRLMKSSETFALRRRRACCKRRYEGWRTGKRRRSRYDRLHSRRVVLQDSPASCVVDLASCGCRGQARWLGQQHQSLIVNSVVSPCRSTPSQAHSWISRKTNSTQWRALHFRAGAISFNHFKVAANTAVHRSIWKTSPAW